MEKINLERIAERYEPTLDEYLIPLVGMLKYAFRIQRIPLQNDLNEEEKIEAYIYVRTQAAFKFKLIHLAWILGAGYPLIEYFSRR